MYSIYSMLLSSSAMGDSPMHKAFTRNINTMVRDLRRAPSPDLDLSGEFSTEEIKTALKCIKPNKAAGVDKIRPEFILHQGDKANEWLRVFLSVCHRTSKIPKIWRRAKIVALPKLNKPLDDPKVYRPV